MRKKALCEERMRLDAFLASCVPDISRSAVKELIGDVSVNGRAVTKLSKSVFPGDEIEFLLDDERCDIRNPDTHSDPIDLDVIHEDDCLLVINKRQGVPVHHGNGHYSGTIEDGLYFMMDDARREEMAEFRYGIVHRLDMDTSGLMVIAKTRRAAEFLIGEFKSHRVLKEYLALAKGLVSASEGRLETGIRRSDRNRLKFETCPCGEGKLAITEYKVLKYFSDKATLLSVLLKTGRTHQIRVHLKSMGNPIFGDAIYGFGKADGMSLMLHARRLGFEHPNGGHMEFDSGVPLRFERIEEGIGGL